jgi:hypothetical protein
MDTAFTVPISSNHALKTPATNEALLRRSQAQARTQMFDDDYGCGQRNGAPLSDRRLIRAVADLDN